VVSVVRLPSTPPNELESSLVLARLRVCSCCMLHKKLQPPGPRPKSAQKQRLISTRYEMKAHPVCGNVCVNAASMSDLLTLMLTQERGLICSYSDSTQQYVKLTYGMEDNCSRVMWPAHKGLGALLAP